MSARIEAPTTGHHVAGGVMVAVVVALAVGALVVTLATTGSDERPVGAVNRTAETSWDAQKLEAMQGRMLAETVAAPGAWDAQKLEAMAGRMRAEEVRRRDAATFRSTEGRDTAVRDGFAGITDSGYRTGGPI